MVWPKIAHDYDPLLAGSRDGSKQDPHDNAIFRAMSAKYKPSTKGKPECTIFIGRMNKVTTEDDLYKLCQEFGEITRLSLIIDIVTKSSKMYAFCEYAEERSVEDACRYLNNTVVHDYQIYVAAECSRTWKGWIPRRLGGGVGGNKKSGQLRFGGETRPFRNAHDPPDLNNRERKSLNSFQRNDESTDYRNTERNSRRTDRYHRQDLRDNKKVYPKTENDDQTKANLREDHKYNEELQGSNVNRNGKRKPYTDSRKYNRYSRNDRSDNKSIKVEVL